LIRYQVGDEQVGVEVHNVEGRCDLPSFECEFLFEDHKSSFFWLKLGLDGCNLVEPLMVF
jgi:hypothetical protein